jgi:hypothetical protein
MTPSEWIVAAAVAQFHDQLTVPPLTSVLSALHGWFASCGADCSAAIWMEEQRQSGWESGVAALA